MLRHFETLRVETVLSLLGLLESLSQCSEATCPATVDDLVAYPDHESAEQFGIDLDVNSDGLAIGSCQRRGQLFELAVAERSRTAHVRDSSVADRRRQPRKFVKRVGRCRPSQTTHGLDGQSLGHCGDLAVEQPSEQLAFGLNWLAEIRHRLLQLRIRSHDAAKTKQLVLDGVELVLVCGGGRHNGAIMSALRDILPARVMPVEAAGLDGDMLEAQAFGWLAVRVMRGLPTSGPGTTGVPAPACGGRISHPRL